MHSGLWHVALPVFWALATPLFYLAARAVNRRTGAWWSSPLLLSWLFCLVPALLLHTSYREYLVGTHWLLTLLGPTTVAFALPIYEQRELIRRHWPILAVGLVVGCSVALGSSWLLATWLSLSPELCRTLLPRSFTTPFAMAASSDVGGRPDLTAVCVVVTGILGGMVGESLRKLLPLRSTLARGMMFGMGAHGVGVAKAREVGREEGSVAGLVMVLAGLSCVAVAPLVALFLH
ncbi:LrgB family protein [Desulfovibrio sp. X2]|uniref:LrgB family protein n=1 Tax=Desulfovibrio sp. X2 TaxID=941449 RepID=UPI0003588177|nr:LrgB family protein [Desulfovibrio sp. X2]EPR43732.1 LrgB family protein [Desulfovibrio sp. X2]